MSHQHPPLTEGPLGFPLTDTQAKTLDTIIKKLPSTKEYDYRKTVFTKAPTELNDGERSDVSWISTEAPDRVNEVVIAKGMDDSQFALNPIVTLCHDYSIPPIGRSLWRKFQKDGQTRGIKAKTIYPAKPESWGDDTWPPDKVFTLVQMGLLNGKSIGWLPIKTHWADDKEVHKNEWPQNTLVIDEWLLIEYAVATIPCNPETVVDVVAKAGKPTPELCKALGWDMKLFEVSPKKEEKGETVKFTPLSEIEKAMSKRVESISLPTLIQDLFDRKRGRV